MMNLTSEQVHWIFGGVLIAVTVTLALRDIGKLQARSLDYLVPGLLAAFGVEMLVDPLVHGTAAPGNYAAETAQHFALGLLLIATSIAELIRIRRGGEGLLWRTPLAAALAVAAASFWLHAQHDSDAPMILLVTQHRMIAATLAVASIAALAGFSGEDRTARHAPALAYLMLVLGAQLLIYTEGSSPFGADQGDHMSMGSMR